MKNYAILLIPLAVLLILVFAALKSGTNKKEVASPVTLKPQEQVAEPKVEEEKTSEISYIIKTSKGDIAVLLDKTVAPITVENFINKANSDYYKGLIFHRVEDWVIQGGDPLGNGTGGGDIKTELSDKPFKTGSLGVARAGNIEISNDSQFFICTTDCSFLTGEYTNFGDVVSGMDVAKSMSIGDKIISITPGTN